MITKITNSNELVSSIPHTMFQHNENDGLIQDDIVINAAVTVPPNSRTILDTQTQYLKIQYNRTLTIFSGEPDINLNSLSNQDEYEEWKHTRVYIMNSKVVIHQYDKYPDHSGASIIQRDGYYIEFGDAMYLYINQNTGYNTVTIYY
ncbi:MAG: hypothetical protein ACK4Q5_08130 [Saprospiraceae bacterium]